ncbi:MAG: BTAD domain-containing putative transcriptional regulator [Gemmatimonadota bacterium]
MIPPARPIRLRLLGTLDVESVEGASESHLLLRQPKRAAVLVYLLLEGTDGLVARDRLTDVFWPDWESTRARAALRQSLRYLRAALPERSLVRRGNRAVGVDTDRVGCDVVRFRGLLEAARPAAALELYRGDLLEGFVVDASDAFDEWLVERREELRTRATGAAWSLAEGAAEATRHGEAAFWSRRAHALSAGEEGDTRRLMRFLARVGDRAGVLAAYAGLEARLAREGDAPDPLTRRIAEEVRALEPGQATPAIGGRGRRSGVDRRSGDDRRGVRGGWTGTERRSGADRRSEGERRSGMDRRGGGG